MTLERSLRLALIWTALLAIGIYAVAAQSLVVAVLGMPSAWLCWWAANQPWAPGVPRLLINAVLLIVVGLGLGLASLDGEFNVERIAEMLASLLVIKLFDRRIARDAAEVLALAVFLVFGAILTSLKLSVGLMLLVFCPLLVWAALVQQVVAADERVEVYQEQIGASRRRVRQGGALSRGLRRMTGLLTISASLIAAAVFVLVPRGLAPSFLEGLGGQRSMVTGYTDTVELGRAGLISESQQKVLEMRVSDPTGGNLGGAGRVYYLRGAVLDSYENGRWTRGRRGSSDFRPLQTGPDQRLQTDEEQTRAVVVQEISLYEPPAEDSMVFAIQQPFLWEFNEPLKFLFDARLGTLRLEQNARTQSYVVHSGLPGPRLSSGEPPVGLDPRRLPDFDSPAIRELTVGILEGAGQSGERAWRSPADVANATRVIREHLQGFEYTLDILRAEGDPIEWFLLDEERGQRGHCEYFASAMVAMCRSVGINARVVTGYVAVEYNDATAQYTVRESNAHAWVEVEHAPGQWRRHDPTPPADLERVHAPDASLAAAARRWMDALEFFWVDSVVSFDRGSQRRVLGSEDAGDEPQIAALESISEFVQRARQSGWVGIVQAVVAGGLAFAGVLVITILAQSFFRRLGIGGGRGPRVRVLGGTREVGEFLLRTLEKAGHPKPGWKPLLAHVTDMPGGSVGFSDVVARLYEARFGDRPLTAEEATGLRRAIVEASERLGSAAPASG
jgi:transglutaminase-like putative cysteine protease